MFLTHLKVKAYVLDTRYEFAFASDVTETAKAEFKRKGMLPTSMSLRAFLDAHTLDPDRPDTNGAASPHDA
jgi:hypothetical protein